MNQNYNFFMSLSTQEYKGKWIAICKKKVVASGINADKVIQKAKKQCPKSRPFIAKIPSEDTLLY